MVRRRCLATFCLVLFAARSATGIRLWKPRESAGFQCLQQGCLSLQLRRFRIELQLHQPGTKDARQRSGS